MAEVFLDPAFTSIRGRVGGVVFYGYGGKTYFRSYAVPRNPSTPAQRANRGLFRDAMKAWQALSSFDRELFCRRARRLGMYGHNLYISRYMSRHRAPQAGSAVPRAPGDLLRQDAEAARVPSVILHPAGPSSPPQFHVPF